MKRSLIAIALLLVPTAAIAHGEWDWIAKGNYRSAMGTHCCDSRDCHRGGVSNVARAGDGFDFDALIDGKVYRIHAPMKSVHPSVNADYWFCALPQDYLDGKARCLFLPGSV